MFQRFYESLMNAGEDFFDGEKEEKERKAQEEQEKQETQDSAQ